MEIDLKCSWCLLQHEDDTHVLFACSFTQEIWDVLGIQHFGVEGSATEIIYRKFDICTRKNWP